MRKKLTGQANQCPTCGEYFNSNYAFDKHRVGEYVNGGRRCLSVVEMKEAGMAKNFRNLWVSALKMQHLEENMEE